MMELVHLVQEAEILVPLRYTRVGYVGDFDTRHSLTRFTLCQLMCYLMPFHECYVQLP